MEMLWDVKLWQMQIDADGKLQRTA